jgi:hypothetical protein
LPETKIRLLELLEHILIGEKNYQQAKHLGIITVVAKVSLFGLKTFSFIKI